MNGIDVGPGRYSRPVPPPPFTIEFFENEDGTSPVLTWLRHELTPTLRRAAGHAMNEILQHQGIEVCDSGWGKHVAPGIFEFRIDRDPQDVIDRQQGREPQEPSARILLRIFCHAHGNKLILLPGGYDKAVDDSRKRQQSEIEIAKSRLSIWKQRQKRAAKDEKRARRKK